MAAEFTDLPPEITNLILEKIDHPDTLRCLLYASPESWRIYSKLSPQAKNKLLVGLVKNFNGTTVTPATINSAEMPFEYRIPASQAMLTDGSGLIHTHCDVFWYFDNIRKWMQLPRFYKVAERFHSDPLTLKKVTWYLHLCIFMPRYKSWMKKADETSGKNTMMRCGNPQHHQHHVEQGFALRWEINVRNLAKPLAPSSNNGRGRRSNIKKESAALKIKVERNAVGKSEKKPVKKSLPVRLKQEPGVAPRVGGRNGRQGSQIMMAPPPAPVQESRLPVRIKQETTD
ncbi:hypothetical protein QBC35DRAFT_476157 [Podospora australis]|uniref:F-box domain-containing protein n=1 Tax=Podospora australis TaxID=1536484 RepID=A0AAN6WQN1_9PEZI|nr:hypothetical protein QBC35DRAFT_476157 [Podospora australis]